MKKLLSFGKSLSKDEQKRIAGGKLPHDGGGAGNCCLVKTYYPDGRVEECEDTDATQAAATCQARPEGTSCSYSCWC